MIKQMETKTKFFSRKSFKFENATAELDTVKSNNNKLFLSTCITLIDFIQNEGITMNDYQHSRYWSKIAMKCKAAFRKHFNNQISIFDYNFPNKTNQISKKTYITIDIVMKNESDNWKNIYDKNIENYLDECYQIIISEIYYI